MRYVQFQLVPVSGSLHPLSRILREDDLVTQEAIHHLRLLADDTVVGLYELEGEVDHLRTTFDEHPAMVDYTVSRSNGAVYAHARTRPTDALRKLLAIQRQYDIVVDGPIEHTSRGGFRITAVGTLDTVRETVSEHPEEVNLVVETTGEYVPRRNRPFVQLTARQREVVRTALDCGYYETPRQCTYDDIAEELGISPETVGEHLRKAEATFVRMAVP